MGKPQARLFNAFLQFVMLPNGHQQVIKRSAGDISERLLEREPPEAGLLELQIEQSVQRWEAQTISDAAFATLYFLAWQIEGHGDRFASRKRLDVPKPEPQDWLDATQRLSGTALDQLLCQFTQDYGFLKVPRKAIAGLHGWLRGTFLVQLQLSIPSPTEVLTLQAAGVRPLTLLTQFPRARLPVLHKPNALAFMLHDLEHATRFFEDDVGHRMQRHFFRSMKKALRLNLFEDYLADPVFSERMDYLISDMNTHPVHSIRFLHAVLIEAQLRREGLGPEQALKERGRHKIRGLLSALSNAWNLDSAAKDAMLALEGGQFGIHESKALERAFAIPG